MKITIESTKTITTINGTRVRIWEGQTENGIVVHAYVAAITINENEPRADEFTKEFIKLSPFNVEQ